MNTLFEELAFQLPPLLVRLPRRYEFWQSLTPLLRYFSVLDRLLFCCPATGWSLDYLLPFVMDTTPSLLSVVRASQLLRQ